MTRAPAGGVEVRRDDGAATIARSASSSLRAMRPEPGGVRAMPDARARNERHLMTAGAAIDSVTAPLQDDSGAVRHPPSAALLV